MQVRRNTRHLLASRRRRRLRQKLPPSVPSCISVRLTPVIRTEKNVENAKRYSRFAVDRHYLPITPHIYFTQFMDDNIPEERDTAIFMNWVLMSKCLELWVFGDTVSSGMKAEIERAKRKHMKIRYFTEDLEEKI